MSKDTPDLVNALIDEIMQHGDAKAEDGSITPLADACKLTVVMSYSANFITVRLVMGCGCDQHAATPREALHVLTPEQQQSAGRSLIAQAAKVLAERHRPEVVVLAVMARQLDTMNKELWQQWSDMLEKSRTDEHPPADDPDLARMVVANEAEIARVAEETRATLAKERAANN